VARHAAGQPWVIIERDGVKIITRPVIGKIAPAQRRRRLFALRNRDAYKDHEKLTLRRTQLDKEERDLTAEQTRLARATHTVQDLATEAQRVADRQAELSLAISRHVRDLVEAADGAGLRRDGEPADTGSDLQVSAKALASARRTDITQVRSCLTQVRDAERDRGSAEKAAGAAQQGLTDREADSRTAGERLDVARANLAAELGTWVARWCEDEPSAVVTAEQADALALSLDRIAEPETPTLSELFTALTQDRMAALIAGGEQLASRDAQLARDEIRLSGEREAIAAERDDAPPASDLRPADRDGRTGAPLWQLVRFTDDVAGPQAAAIEGALYGAGMLTAWVHPDPAMTVAAIADAEADGYLVALPPEARPAGRTLADVLVPEDQSAVPPAVVQAVLSSVRVTDEIPGLDAGADPAGGGSASAVVTTRAQFSYGPHLGAAEAGARVHRRDQPGQPAPYPHRRARPCDRGGRGRAGGRGDAVTAGGRRAR
jgi:hypothetical protein